MWIAFIDTHMYNDVQRRSYDVVIFIILIAKEFLYQDTAWMGLGSYVEPNLGETFGVVGYK